MIKIIHRVNTIAYLKTIPVSFGVEVDIRAYTDQIILNHEPFQKGELFEDYLKQYAHAFIVLNIKEAGIEQRVLDLVNKYKIKKYFLLDVEFPYIYTAARAKNRHIAIRYSEDEPIQAALQYKDLLDWVWIDCNTRLPLNSAVIKKLAHFKTCLVSPDRWGRPEDIPLYRKKMAKLGFTPDAVMMAYEYESLW